MAHPSRSEVDEAIKKRMIFAKTLKKMLKQGLTLQILNKARLLPKGKSRKVIGLMKDELGGQLLKEFVRLGAKRYRKDNNEEDLKKAKGKKKKKEKKRKKKCVIKRNGKFPDHKICLAAAQTENKINYLKKK